jgi:inner membrane protein
VGRLNPVNGPTHLGFGAAGGLVLLPQIVAAHGEHWSHAQYVGASCLTMALAVVPDWDGRLGLKHRGPTHRLWFVLALWAVAKWAVVTSGQVWAWWLPAAVAIGIGVGGHLPDMLTDKGLRWLSPLTKIRFRLATISTGKGVEKTLRWVLWVAVGVYAAAGPMLVTGVRLFLRDRA